MIEKSVTLMAFLLISPLNLVSQKNTVFVILKLKNKVNTLCYKNSFLCWRERTKLVQIVPSNIKNKTNLNQIK